MQLLEWRITFFPQWKEHAKYFWTDYILLKCYNTWIYNWLFQIIAELVNFNIYFIIKCKRNGKDYSISASFFFGKQNMQECLMIKQIGNFLILLQKKKYSSGYIYVCMLQQSTKVAEPNLINPSSKFSNIAIVSL